MAAVRISTHCWYQSILPYRAKFNDIRSEAVELAKAGTDVEVATLKDWLRESHKLAKSHVYTPYVLEAAEGTRPLGKLDLTQGYREAAGRLSKRRATEAGWGDVRGFYYDLSRNFLYQILRGEVMNRHQCPHCGELGISALRKCFLGPALPTTCESCGQEVGVPYWSIVTLIPMFAGMFAIPNLISNPSYVAMMATFATLTTWVLWESFVVLEKR